MTTDEALRTADDRVQSVIESMHARIMAAQRFAWARARRSAGQRLRNDGREQQRITNALEWAYQTGATR